MTNTYRNKFIQHRTSQTHVVSMYDGQTFQICALRFLFKSLESAKILPFWMYGLLIISHWT